MEPTSGGDYEAETGPSRVRGSALKQIEQCSTNMHCLTKCFPSKVRMSGLIVRRAEGVFWYVHVLYERGVIENRLSSAKTIRLVPNLAPQQV